VQGFGQIHVAAFRDFGKNDSAAVRFHWESNAFDLGQFVSLQVLDAQSAAAGGKSNPLTVRRKPGADDAGVYKTLGADGVP